MRVILLAILLVSVPERAWTPTQADWPYPSPRMEMPRETWKEV